MFSAFNTGNTVILLECFSPVTGLITVITYSPCGKLMFNVAIPFSSVVRF